MGSGGGPRALTPCREQERILLPWRFPASPRNLRGHTCEGMDKPVLLLVHWLLLKGASWAGVALPYFPSFSKAGPSSQVRALVGFLRFPRCAPAPGKGVCFLALVTSSWQKWLLHGQMRCSHRQIFLPFLMRGFHAVGRSCLSQAQTGVCGAGEPGRCPGSHSPGWHRSRGNNRWRREFVQKPTSSPA